MTSDRFLTLSVVVVGVFVGCFFSLPASSQSQVVVTIPIVRNAPSAKEEQFLVCAARCRFGDQVDKPIPCLNSCQADAKLTGREVARLIRPGLATIGGSGGGQLGFNCDPFEPTCSCSGFFDCKVLEKSGCCSKPVNSCHDSPGKPEICTCEKSPQCSL
jgi:hypothetical protein